MPINPAMTLKEIALSNATAGSVLESYHLDYCWEGEQTLAKACRKANLDLDEVVAALEQTHGKGQFGPGERESTLTEQAGFIFGRHHVFTRAKLPRTETLLARIIERQGSAQPELKAVGDCFDELQAILDPHMLREEQVLLPHIEALDKYRRGETTLPPGCFGAIEDLIRQSQAEHQAVGNLLRKIRELTSVFSPPADASSSYETTYHALEELETDLMHHIHLENNVLFPRVQLMIGTV
jgi:regulator of cell morphogenesis and NO signaling